MYRHVVDDATTYTPDDLVLFRESPFAAWMERLTLENPEHGIPPDLESIASYHQSPRPDDGIVATLRAEGRNVALIDPAQDETARRAATLAAMRAGADFIVSGQLAVENLSGAVDLLMRTSGFSALGDYLYIPCSTRADNSLQASFRLCFYADLLATLQGQLPPQMLVIRDGAEVFPLQTEDHVYYYRAVLKRFLTAMRNFRKHRMPDPAESAHFGRWAECASEVLKQRASSEQLREEEQDEQQQYEEQLAAARVEEIPQLRVASGAGVRTQYDVDGAGRAEFVAANQAIRSTLLESSISEKGDSSPTLAEQAQLLKPGSYRIGTPPGHTPSLARIGKPRSVASAAPDASRNPPPQSLSNDALDIVALTGSSPATGSEGMFSSIVPGEAMRPAPAPNLRGPSPHERPAPAAQITAAVVRLPDLEPRPPVFLPPDETQYAAVPPPGQRLDTQWEDQVPPEVSASSVIDLDSAPASNLAPVVQRAEAVFERLLRDDPVFRKADVVSASWPARDENEPLVRPFSNSLETSEEFNDSEFNDS